MKSKIIGSALVLVLVITILGVAPVSVSAATINVPGDYATIQEAIDAASPGDTINVAAGNYYENITLKDGVVVQGTGADVTTIDGEGSGSVVTANSVGSGTVLEGFTITGGSATNGGGMYNSYSSPIVTGCSFSSNTATWGGGMHNVDSSPTVTGCSFSSNTATWGGGMYNSYSSPVVTNCTFSGNSATSDGGGMYNWYSSPMVTNCILWGDSPQEIYDSSSTPTVTYCDVQGGYAGEGNILEDPMFVDPGAGDYHLQVGSPCIDAGSNAAVPGWLTTDFEGDPRIVDGDGDTVAVVDMGADEYYALPQIEEFTVKHMFIDFDCQPNKDDIAITRATFSLQEGATYDLSVDEVTVNIDGVDITIPAGSFKQLRRGERYIYTSPWQVKPAIAMVLNFDQGEWSLFVHDVDASVIDNSDGVDVTFAIGSMSASEHVNMWVERLSYEAEP